MKKLLGILFFVLLIAGFAAAENVVSNESESSIVVAFEANDYSTLVGKTITVKPVIQGYKGKTKYSYSSDDTSIATVTEAGTVKGLKAGSTKITCIVTLNDVVYDVSYNLFVMQPVKQIKFEKSSIEMHSRETYDIPVTILPADATSTQLEWKSSNSSVATVDENNVIHGHLVGSATLTATAKDGSGVKATLKVKIPRVSFAEKNVTIDTPDGYVLTYWINDENGIFTITSGTSGKCITSAIHSENTWERVEKKVRLIPIKTGSGKYIVSINGKNYSVNVKVTRNAIYENAQYSQLGKNKSLQNLRFSMSGSIVNIEEGEENYNITMLFDQKTGQYTIVSLPKDKKTDQITVDTVVTINGVFDSMVDYTAASGLKYSVPHFSCESISIVK